MSDNDEPTEPKSKFRTIASFGGNGKGQIADNTTGEAVSAEEAVRRTVEAEKKARAEGGSA